MATRHSALADHQSRQCRSHWSTRRDHVSSCLTIRDSIGQQFSEFQEQGSAFLCASLRPQDVHPWGPVSSVMLFHLLKLLQ